jgi:hypothetical protein
MVVEKEISMKRVLMVLMFILSFQIVSGSPKSKVRGPDDWHLVKKWAVYYSNYYRVPQEVVFRILENESGWKVDSPKTSYVAHEQIGSAGELGSMQEKLKTVRALWHDSTITRHQLLYDIQFNIKSGVFLLTQEYEHWRDHCRDDWNRAWLMTACSYNKGRGCAVKWDKPNHYAERAITKKTKLDTTTGEGKFRKGLVKSHKKSHSKVRYANK